jgi:hypothetical protein
LEIIMPDESIESLKEKAARGDAEAQYSLAVCYAYGNGVDTDQKEAVRLYRLAAEQGNAQAQFKLGARFQNGIGVDKDQKEAVRYYRLAAEQGNADAQYYLAVCYAYGNGVNTDQKEAVRLYRLAAEQGNAQAQFKLGARFQNGIGVDKNEKEAAKFYRLAAEQGNVDAQYYLYYSCNQKILQNNCYAANVQTAPLTFFQKARRTVTQFFAHKHTVKAGIGTFIGGAILFGLGLGLTATGIGGVIGVPLTMTGVGLMCAGITGTLVGIVTKVVAKRKQTVPDMLAAITTFHPNCTEQQKQRFRQMLHELYSVPENRPIMEHAAWRAINGKRPLSMDVAPGTDIKLLGRDARGDANGTTGKVRLSFDENDIARSAGTVIHELYHIAVHDINENQTRAYLNNQERRDSYVGHVDSTKSSEARALTYKEQAIVMKMLELYTHTIHSNEPNAWEKERIARIPQLITQYGRKPVEAMYPRETAHSDRCTDRVAQSLRDKGWDPPSPLPLAKSAATSVPDAVDLLSVSHSILWRAQVSGWGTLRMAAPESYTEKEKEQQMALVSKLKALEYTNESVQNIYNNNPKELHKLCDHWAKSYEAAFAKDNDGKAVFEPAKISPVTAPPIIAEAEQKTAFAEKEVTRRNSLSQQGESRFNI